MPWISLILTSYPDSMRPMVSIFAARMVPCPPTPVKRMFFVILLRLTFFKDSTGGTYLFADIAAHAVGAVDGHFLVLGIKDQSRASCLLAELAADALLRIHHILGLEQILEFVQVFLREFFEDVIKNKNNPMAFTSSSMFMAMVESPFTV